MPYLAALGTAIIVSIAGKSHEEFVAMAARLDGVPGVAALELNISCPNVSGGVDFGTDPGDVREGGRRRARGVLAADPGQADAQRDRHRRDRPGGRGRRGRRRLADQHLPGHGRRLAAPPADRLGNVLGGLSGPAIKPIALRAVYQVARAVEIPLVGIGGIATIDDVMEFLVAGATAVQIGTANFYNPTVSMQILDALPAALAELGARRSPTWWERWKSKSGVGMIEGRSDDVVDLQTVIPNP